MPLKSDDIEVWFNRINKAEDFQSNQHETWSQIIKLFKGTFFSKPTDNSGEITEVNFANYYIQVLLSAIYAKDPFIFVRARIGERAGFAETMELVINYYWKELFMKNKIKSTVKTGILNPPGFIELGYLFMKEKKDEFTEQLEEEFPELKKEDKRKPLETQGIFDETIKEDDIFAKTHTAWKVIWPDGYHNIRECPWMAIVEDVPLLDIKSNPSFSSIKDKLSSTTNSSTSSTNRNNSFGLKDDVRALNMTPQDALDEENVIQRLYHVFDKRSQRRFTLAKGFSDGALADKKWEFLPEGFPLFPLFFNEIPETDENAHSYGLSDLVPLLPQLKELSKINSAMMRHRKRAGTMILAREGSISADEITNISESDDVDVITLRNIEEKDLKVWNPPALPNDFYRLRDTIMQDLLRLSGIPQLLSGGTSGVETATESENIRLGAQLLQSEKVDIIEDYTKDLARYMSGLIWQYKSRKQISEILGEEISPEMWPDLPKKANGDLDVTKARRIIQKEIFFDIEAGSTRPPKDENVERKLWMDVVNSVKQQFPGRLNDAVILPQLLNKFDFKDIDKAVIQFDEEEAQVAQQENQLLLQGVPIPVSPNQNHKVHSQIHSAIVNQGQSTKELEEHLLQHVSKDQQQNEGSKGSGTVRRRDSASDVKRRGVPENVDFIGATNTPQRGINRGGTG